MALPQSPIIKIDPPNFVNLPKPSKANGQMPAQINELDNPNNTTNQIEISVVCPKKCTCPFENIISNVKQVPNNVQVRNAFTCLIKRGMQMMPMIYPQTVAANVYEGNTLASMSCMFIEPA